MNWQRVGDEYPTYESGLHGHVLCRHHAVPAEPTTTPPCPSSSAAWSLATLPEDQARAYLWIGKTQEKLGNAAGGAERLAAGTERRSRRLLQRACHRTCSMGRPPFAPPRHQLRVRSGCRTPGRRFVDAPHLQAAAETDLSGLGTLASDPRLIRGRELWNLGLYDEARLEFEDLRNGGQRRRRPDLPPGQLPAGAWAVPLRHHAARQVLTLAGLQDQASSMLAPPYFTHVRYGLYFSDLISPRPRQTILIPCFSSASCGRRVCSRALSVPPPAPAA